MQKPIIITGPPNSGRSFLAKTLTLAYKNPFIIALHSFRLKEAFTFHGITAFNDVIFADEVKNIEDVNFLLENHVLEVHRKHKSTIYLRMPQLIIVVDADGITQQFIKENASKYNIIECSYNEYKVFQFTKPSTTKSQQA